MQDSQLADFAGSIIRALADGAVLSGLPVWGDFLIDQNFLLDQG